MFINVPAQLVECRGTMVDITLMYDLISYR
jgi:hypothetical protein